ncbi:uncharacterized protein ATNIH1004_004307 [Aspergillus tanneri]|uniref:Major facilitator superfamily (MFS) profile domain-containing protein n=1 Tax=Aspergillus tanneri TaxID=1220188 RepID=A0A5M9MN16_9EURO|nr:uncharacterized protein ATNIH1004_004307 [Aspergillus tanneri]KAA8648422.1 hypothetical protein ATNIH1004_004307 [Aspergillus tanneri]
MHGHNASCLFPGRLPLRLVCAVLCFGLSGTSRGLDEGLIASTVADKPFINRFGLDASRLSPSERANRLSNVTTMVTIGCLPGALLAFLLTEKIGMLWAMRGSCLVWMSGSIIFLTSHTIGQVYAGRLIMGVGIGQFGVVAPVYLGEVSPRQIRGVIIGLFGISDVQVIWAGILLFFSLFCEESPRFLCKRGRADQAAQALGKLWQLPALHTEVQDEIRAAQRQLELENGNSTRSFWETVRTLFTTKENLKRIAFIFTVQCLIQRSGPTSLTTYAPKLFSLFGIKGESEKLFTTAIFGAVKFASALGSALFMIDFIGRRRTLYIGVTMQILAFLYISIFLTVFYTLSEEKQQSPATKRSAIGAIVMVYLIGVSYALGWNSIQYIITAEIFPLPVRIAGSSVATVWHYANRMGLSKAVPTMLLEHGSLTPTGTFWFFTAMSILGGVYALVFLPETSRKGLEETGDLYTGRKTFSQIGHKHTSDR